MYRLVAVDLDGTLFNNERHVSARNRQAIEDVLSSGRILTIATGRPLQGVSDIIDMVGADMPFIIYNGAMVITSKTKRVLYESMLSGDLAAEVARLGERLGATVFVYRNGELYVSEINQMVSGYMSAFKIAPIVPDDLLQIAAQGATKVLFRDTPERISKFQEAARPHFEGRLNFFMSQPNILEFVNLNASKGAAMRIIGERYNIAQSEMFAIGDSYNDASMLRYAGLGVAMGNAPAEIKDIADAVTLTNEEDGVAEAIYRYILN